jgi:DNA polymerase III delta prime subunit
MSAGLVQIKKIWIDLSNLYMYQYELSGARILKRMLRNYNVNIKILLSIDSSGLNIIMFKDYYNIARKIFMRRKESNEHTIERIAKELVMRRKKDIIVVMLYTEKETAVAFAEPKDTISIYQ